LLASYHLGGLIDDSGAGEVKRGKNLPSDGIGWQIAMGTGKVLHLIGVTEFE